MPDKDQTKTNDIDASDAKRPIQSPCVSICALDSEDICVGCYRSGDEISRWGSMDDAEKLQTLERVSEREKKSYI